MPTIRVIACFYIYVVCQLSWAPALMAGEPYSVPVDNASLLETPGALALPEDNKAHIKRILAQPVPGDDEAYLKILRAQGPRCRASETFGARDVYAQCKGRLLTALAALNKPSSEVLTAALEWYWSSKRRTSANEAMQERLFNQLESPYLDAILMERRYLQSAMEFSNIQNQLAPDGRDYWDIVPARNRYRGIEELFHRAYDLPASARGYASGYPGGNRNRQRIYGSATLQRGNHTGMSRLLDHVLGFVGEDPVALSRKKNPRIPDNLAFWKTVALIHNPPMDAGSRTKGATQTLESRLKQVSRLYAQWLQTTPRVADMARPGAGKTFIEYIFYRNRQTGRDHYAAFSFSTTAPVSSIRFSDLGPALTIGKRITGLRQAILHKLPVAKQQRQLAALLVEPLSIDSSQTAEIVISPDAALDSLPFALLFETQPDEAAIVSYNDSWSILMQQFWRQAHLDRPVATTAGIILAAPDYGGELKTVSADLDVAGQERKGSDAWPRFFAPLAYTEREGEAIAQRSPEPVIFLSGKQASEFALFERNHPKFVHIASHGYFLSADWQRRNQHKTDPRYSVNPWVLPELNAGLALAGANQLLAGTKVGAFRQDGLLTVSDAASLNLLGTELVVLSACDTGLGLDTTQHERFVGVGRGASNLRAAFRQAGASNVVMSLWPVADKVTWWLMDEFYRSWFSGVPPKLALSQAKIRLRQRLRKNAMDDHPYYWAGFVIQGEF